MSDWIITVIQHRETKKLINSNRLTASSESALYSGMPLRRQLSREYLLNVESLVAKNHSDAHYTDTDILHEISGSPRNFHPFHTQPSSTSARGRNFQYKWTPVVQETQQASIALSGNSTRITQDPASHVGLHSMTSECLGSSAVDDQCFAFDGFMEWDRFGGFPSCFPLFPVAVPDDSATAGFPGGPVNNNSYIGDYE